MCALLIGSFWVYVEHPEWLEGSNAEDERVEKILEANPELSLEDLEADFQTGDLSFWLRTEPGSGSRANNQKNRNRKNQEPDPLEAFMKKQRQEEKKKQRNSTSNNPLLNFSSLENLTNTRNSQDPEDIQIGKINLDTQSLSTPLDRMLRGEAGNNELTPLESEILSLQQLPLPSTDNILQTTAENSSPSSENLTGLNNSNVNNPLTQTSNNLLHQTLNNPDNLLPNATNNSYNNPSGLGVNSRRTTAQPSLNQTTRRGSVNPPVNGANGVNGINGANGVNGVNGVIPTTPVVPIPNSRRAVVSPRVATPNALPTTPTFNNNSQPFNDPYSQSQPARLNQPTQTPRAVNPNNRIGSGEIHTFSDPYGTRR
ncbi:MAG: hypothetical protein AB4290_22275, partial [Spirulina sp.]